MSKPIPFDASHDAALCHAYDGTADKEAFAHTPEYYSFMAGVEWAEKWLKESQEKEDKPKANSK